MNYIPTFVTTFITLLKQDPKRARTIVLAAIGALTIATQVIEQVVLPILYKAIEVLNAALSGLPVAAIRVVLAAFPEDPWR